MHASMNLATIGHLPMERALALTAETGFTAAGLSLDAVRAAGGEATARMLREHGLTASSICPSGLFGTWGESGLAKAVDQTKEALDIAKAIGADTLCVLAGSFPRDRTDIHLARDFARRGLDIVVPYAKGIGQSIGLEPLHPVYIDFSVIHTVGEALDWCEHYDIGLFFDINHVWWDYQLPALQARAKGRVTGFHVCDWKRPTNDTIHDREIPGRGIVDIEAMFRWVREAGYDSAAEIEIFSHEHCRRDAGDFLRDCRESLRTYGV
ncbi:MAG: sugar phosphate isomerase/epimerase family protein [Opitutales bacterium]